VSLRLQIFQFGFWGKPSLATPIDGVGLGYHSGATFSYFPYPIFYRVKLSQIAALTLVDASLPPARACPESSAFESEINHLLQEAPEIT
jgi:hypothetical protein